MEQAAPKSRTRFSVRDKSILITAATGSLGRVAAGALAGAGARLTLAGGNSAGPAELVDDAGIDGAVVVSCRPETPADVHAMVEAAATGHHLYGTLTAARSPKTRGCLRRRVSDSLEVKVVTSTLPFPRLASMFARCRATTVLPVPGPPVTRPGPL